MRVGLDIGSTTIKCVVLNDAGQIVYSTYERHFSHILEKGRALLEKVAAEYLPDGRAYLAISGSAGMGLADSCKVPFVQEVFATRVAANRLAPGTDCIIELGGEDAKIIYFDSESFGHLKDLSCSGIGHCNPAILLWLLDFMNCPFYCLENPYHNLHSFHHKNTVSIIICTRNFVNSNRFGLQIFSISL